MSFAKNDGPVIFQYFLLILSVLNDCFNNSLIIMYNLEVTIAATFSLIISLKSLLEAGYSYGFLYFFNYVIQLSAGLEITEQS